MTLSLNEVETLVRKAALGAGLDPGRAGDLAGAALWLTAVNVPVFEIAYRALISKEGPPLAVTSYTKQATCLATAAARIGPSAIDLLVAKPPGFTVALDAVDEPLIIAALAARTAWRDAAAFTIETTETTIEIGPTPRPDVTPLTAGTARRLVLHRAQHAAVPVAENPEPPSRYDPTHVGDTGFADLDHLARLTYVPATEYSRLAGAGAGLTDND